MVRAIGTLRHINGKPAEQFWKEVGEGYRPAPDAAWFRQVAALPEEKRVEAVTDRLKEQDPKATFAHSTDKVRGLSLTWRSAGGLTDLSPLRALPGLTRLTISQENFLSPPPPISDLSPLAGMKLTDLLVSRTLVWDLSPLSGMPLAWLDCSHTSVSDLSPLKGMKTLTTLTCNGTRVRDLSPLAGLTLRIINGDCDLERDAATLRPMRSLTTIDGASPVARWADVDWLKEAAAMPAERLAREVAARLDASKGKGTGKVVPRIEGDVVTGLEVEGVEFQSLWPVRALQGLRSLRIIGTNLGRKGFGRRQTCDLTPLRGLKLTHLEISALDVVSLAPLSGMPLEVLDLGGMVRDLAPLRGMRLSSFSCVGFPALDFSPLIGMPLKEVRLQSPFAFGKGPPFGKGLRLDKADALRMIRTLKTINGVDAAEFLKKLR
jgi:hypothetical protein